MANIIDNKYILIMSDVYTGQAGNCFIRIQFFSYAIFLGNNPGGYGARLFIFAPNKNEEWKCNKFSFENSFKRAKKYKKHKQKKNTVIFKREKDYNIWVSLKTEKFHIEMKGCQLSRTPYDTSEKAIEKAKEIVLSKQKD
jgi:hypothetical protein